jgi:hypothetical protein
LKIPGHWPETLEGCEDKISGILANDSHFPVIFQEALRRHLFYLKVQAVIEDFKSSSLE